ncbi:hypothetical protein GOP47_0018631 [Adiantum capillus-veneris]|uniref:peptidylprolyl isomerase n=1 Tax=Adiantum capillus-veneris TaxID=13818 RepID=A0A9D4Z9U1_ADICA|nr:hypothetical protein GOP47_0018631 [Adiantum capillus-veneris]
MEALPAVHAGAVSRVSAAARLHPLPSRLRLSFAESFACPSRLLLTNSYCGKSIGIYSVCAPPHAVQLLLPSASTVADAVEVSESFEPNSRVKLSVKVAPKICKESYELVLKELSKRTKIPGFQVGKAVPEPILVNFVGKDRVKTAAIEAVLRNTLPQALSSVAGRALKDSEHIVTSLDDLKSSFSPTSLLSYDVVVDIVPEVKWTTPGAYKRLKVIVEIDDESVYQKAAEAEFRSGYKDLGSLHVVQDRCIEAGDVVILDVACNRVNEDGTVGDRIISAEQKGFQLDTEDGLSYLPGFVDAIYGMKRGEIRVFELVFPDTWQVEATRGATGRFEVHVKEHFYRVFPTLDDSLAGKFLENCETLDQVREAYLKKHQEQYELQKLRTTQNMLMNELAKVTQVDVPNSLIEEQGRNMFAGKLLELQARMNLNTDQLAGLSSQEMVNNYLISQKQTIIDAVKQVLAVAEIFKLENLRYTEADLKKEVETAEADFKKFNQDYDKERIVEQAKELLEGAKVLDWLMANADISYAVNKL